MKKPVIQICGDPAVDWMTVRQQSEPGLGPLFWTPEVTRREVEVSAQPGGAALLTEFVETLVTMDYARVDGVVLESWVLEKLKAPIPRSWTVWQHQGQEDGKASAFRIAEFNNTEPGIWDYAAQVREEPADLLLIDDAGMGFRDCPDGWPVALLWESDVEPEQIIVKLRQYSDGKGSPVLDRIVERGLAGRTAIVTSVDDLRECDVLIPGSLSWERLMEHVVSAVRGSVCPFADPMSQLKFQRVIVVIGAAGAVIVERDSNSLIFDRSGQEGDFEGRFAGRMMGYNSCVLGALASAWAESRTISDWEQATLDGMALARLLHLGGYEVLNRTLKFPFSRLQKAYETRLQLDPAKRTGASGGVWDLSVFKDQSAKAAAADRTWSILNEIVNNGSNASSPILERAARIARQGPEAALKSVPVETMGKWCSADRDEIEGVRSLRNAMQQYLGRARVEQPLAVAVFGPPGAGKSFVVRQVAEDLGIGGDAHMIFNLSQFSATEQLAGAFQQIRDLNLKGKTPLVLWDEFDSALDGRPLAWLRYFLEPAQAGGGIYVFVGGASNSFKEFCESDPALKKYEFISRLRAFLDVRGTDPVSVGDDLYMIRRALLIHSLLEQHAPHLYKEMEFQISDGVLRALFRARRYNHAARSLESIITMSTLKGRRKFELSCLPPESLLSMHVDAAEFIKLALEAK